MSHRRLLVFSIGFVLLAHTAARAQTSYQIQVIARRGDKVGSTQIAASGGFFVGALNDSGEFVFDTLSTSGGELLARYADGNLTPVIAAGGDAPGGKWPHNLLLYPPVNMNQQGSMVFAAPVEVAGQNDVGTFRLDPAANQITVVAENGMPAGNNLVFGAAGGTSPVINNNGEIAFTASVKDVVRNLYGPSVFFLGRDGKLQTVCSFYQTLSDGTLVAWASNPVADDTGRVVFLAEGLGKDIDNVYAWEQGTVAPVLRTPVTAPPGMLMLGFLGAWTNNKNRNVLLNTHFYSLTLHHYSLFLSIDGSPVPVAVPGQTMPGGGLFEALQDGGVSFASERGQHAFMALLQDGSTAAYLMDVDGKLSLILKSGMVTQLGKIADVGQGPGGSQGIGLNSQGQVVLPVRIAGAADAVVLLTPKAP